MFSPVKLALFAFISFATLALAIPSPAGHPQDPRALISNANVDIGKALHPLYYANSTNAAECVPPAIQEVVEIIAELIIALRLSSLSACGCTANEIIALLAVLLKTIFEPLGIVYGSYSGLGSLLGHLVVLVVELLNVVLALVGGLVGELLILLIGNGCAGILLDLNLIAIIKLVGLGGLLGHL